MSVREKIQRYNQPQQYTDFDWKMYISEYEDLSVIQNQKEACAHYRSFGKSEGRNYYVYKLPVSKIIKEIRITFDKYNIELSQDAIDKYTKYIGYLNMFVDRQEITETTNGFFINRRKAINHEKTSIYPYQWTSTTLKLPLKILPTYLKIMIKSKFSFLHSGDLGDIIFSLPTIRDLGGGTLYLDITGTRNNIEKTKFNIEGYNSIRELLLKQFYILDVKIYNGEEITHNLNTFSNLVKNKTNRLSLPELIADNFKIDIINLNFPWIHSNKITTKSIICARGLRNRCCVPYINENFVTSKDYDELNDIVWKNIVDNYKNDILFVGLQNDYDDFAHKFGNVDFLQPDNLLHLTQIINGCKLFICNCSLPHAIAEGLKKPILLEVSGHPTGCFSRFENMWTFTNKSVDIQVVNAIISNFMQS